MTLLKWTFGPLVKAVLLCCAIIGTGGTATEIIFRVGASVGSDGPCALLYDQKIMGYSYFFEWLSKQPAQEIEDAAGGKYRVRLQFRLVTHNCTEAGRAAALSALIKGSQPNAATGDPGGLPVHVLLGGNGGNAIEDSLQADAASRVLIHCCAARDSVFLLNLPTVYGLFTPASLHTEAVLRTFAFSGVQRVAVVGSKDSALHLQLCTGAVQRLPSLSKLRPGFGAVAVINYTVAESKEDGFWDTAAERVMAARADALVACDELSRSAQLVKRLADSGHSLAALWMASYGNISEFQSYLGAPAQYALTTVQWAPNLPFADPDFGTAEEYAAAFRAATGADASYFAAAATATGYVLHTALKGAIALCNMSAVAALQGDLADAFMWREGVLWCYEQSHGVLYHAATGQHILQTVLSSLHMDTFFGPIGFNSYRQNVYHPTIVTQVLGEQMQVVIPLDLANARLVLPIPAEPARSRSWASSTGGIVILTLACCLAAAVLALAAAMGHRYLRPRTSMAMEVEIDPAEIKVDLSPVRNVDGTFEAGEGTYRGTRVKLEVACELLPPLPPPAAPAALQRSPSPLPTQRSRLNVQTVTLSGVPPTEGSSATPSARPSLKDLFSRRHSEGCIDPHATMTPRSTKSAINMQTLQSLTAFASSRRSRRQYSALVWRALRMRHPNVCPIVGIVWEWPGLLDNGVPVPVLVRQWYELGNLSQLLENETVPLPLLDKAGIVTGIAEGLAYLHAQDPPITGGPLLAHRILIDKNFNPHLFLRLTNFDPSLGAPEAAALLLSPPRVRQTTTSLPVRPSVDAHMPGTRPTSNNGGFGIGVGVGGGHTPGTRPTSNNGGFAIAVSGGGGHTPGTRPTSNNGGVGVGGGSSAAAAAAFFGVGAAAPLVQVSPIRTSQRTIARPAQVFLEDAGDSEHAGASPAAGAGSAAGGGAIGGFTTSLDIEHPSLRTVPDTHLSGLAQTPTAAFLAPAPYVPSKAQDVLEFGRLLGSVFVTALEASDSKLPTFSGAGADSSDFRRFGSGNGAGFSPGLRERAPWFQTDELQQAEQDATMLEALEAVCPPLAALARACINPVPDERPAMDVVAAALEGEVRQALTHGLALAPAAAHAVGTSGKGAVSVNRVMQSLGSAECSAAAAAAAAATLSMLSTIRDGSFVALATGGGAGGRRLSLLLGAPAPVSGAGGSPALRRQESSLRRRRGTEGGLTEHPPPSRPDTVPRMMGHMVAPDDLLYDMFPPKVANALRAGETVQPERYDCVSIFFSDVVGYTDLCSQLQPYEVMDLMHRLYSLFDSLCQALQLFKVETVGDAYLAVANLRYPQPDSHARLAAQFAFDAVRAANSLPVHLERPELGCVRIRVGLHCGPVVGSVVGTLNRRFCLFGDAVNTAARMEHNSEADRVNVSGAFAALAAEQWPGVQLTSRGVRHIKGKGQMETFWIEDPRRQQCVGHDGWHAAAAPQSGGSGI